MTFTRNLLNEKNLSAAKNSPVAMPFLDLQAALGITKHPGGYAATDELLALCQIEQAKEVLNVGCGIGVGTVYIAQRFGCHVVGVDLSAKMIAWSRQRAHEAHLAHQVELQVVDVCALPFVADHFDLVICESVLNFVNDKAQALREMVRVTKPGGYVGINETFWQHAPPAGYVPQVRALLGAEQPTAEAWQALWRASGLHAQTVQLHTFDTRQEIKDRIEWVGWVWLVRAWGRALRLILRNPSIRSAIKEQFDFPLEVMQQIGYGLFVGRK